MERKKATATRTATTIKQERRTLSLSLFYTSALFSRAFTDARAFFSSCGRRPTLPRPTCVRLAAMQRRRKKEKERERGHDVVVTSTFIDTFAFRLWRGKKERRPSFTNKKSTTATDTPLCFLVLALSLFSTAFPRPFPFSLRLMAIMMMMMM